MRADIVVVGSGLFGATIARQAAEVSGLDVAVVERRDHIGGNAWSSPDPVTGIEVHRYGTHIFHTSNERVWAWATRFSDFNGYHHRVFANYRGEVYSLPINLGTINQFFRAALSPSQAAALIRDQAASIQGPPGNLEDKAISLIGRPLYEAFVQGYTAKQWQTDPRELPASIITRLPVRLTYNNRYFSDTYEGLPLCGYGTWLTRILDHPRISVHTQTDFLDDGPLGRDAVVGRLPVVYTGPLDRYFDQAHGPLDWRTLDLRTEVVDVADYQGTAVVNYSDLDVPYTRVHEYQHLHPERRPHGEATVITREFSRHAGPDDEPYYPVPLLGQGRAQRYRELADAELAHHRVLFGGRLGSYQYLDMDKAMAAALDAFDRVVRPWFSTAALT